MTETEGEKVSYYDEDFFCEPSEFEMKIEELTQTLTESVKRKFMSELEQLRKENAELQDVKRNFEKIKRDYKAKENQLEVERMELERKVRWERLSILMKDFQIVMYRAWSKRELPPKCGNCDEKRQIKFKTPRGKDAFESCECGEGKLVYYPKEYICSEFSINNDRNGMRAWYKVNPDNNDDYAVLDSSGTFARTIYDENLKYEDIKEYDTFFKTKEECQSYCDYLNNK